MVRAGVPVVLLIMPEGPAFRSWYPAGKANEVLSHVEQLGKKLGVPVVNSREWADREEAFVDSFHLSGTGASEYSARLMREAVVSRMKRR
jgi:hypothetical protein